MNLHRIGFNLRRSITGIKDFTKIKDIRTRENSCSVEWVRGDIGQSESLDNVDIEK